LLPAPTLTEQDGYQLAPEVAGFGVIDRHPEQNSWFLSAYAYTLYELEPGSRVHLDGIRKRTHPEDARRTRLRHRERLLEGPLQQSIPDHRSEDRRCVALGTCKGRILSQRAERAG